MPDKTTNNFSLVDLPDIPASLDNAVKNLTNKPTKKIGDTLADAWFLVFGGLSHKASQRRMQYAHDLERYEKELTESISKIPENERLEPSIQVTAQALENSKYCISSNELRRMFVYLITNTMDNRYESFTHPSFPEIIKQMSPLDARILSSFKNKVSQPIANIVLNHRSGTRKTLERYIFFDINGSYSYPYAASISSLERLGLLSVDFSTQLADKSLYDLFTKFSYYGHLKDIFENKESGDFIGTINGICEITPLGIHFIKSCIPETLRFLQIP